MCFPVRSAGYGRLCNSLHISTGALGQTADRALRMLLLWTYTIGRVLHTGKLRNGQ